MKKVLLFEITGVESHLGWLFVRLECHFLSQWRPSRLRVIQFIMTKQPRKYCKKVDRKQLPTEKLFGPVMFSGRDENLTFTQLEQREIQRNFDFRRFRKYLLSFMQKFEDDQSMMNPNLVYFSLMYMLCAMYSFSYFELY